ncbi:hypothetical protein HOLleu_34306 [Holothuria leucospilota]|uniref:Uncharacterized protein n=1 Tax=Holothuria leucospilota TaxID=206669 RepID=A0A9Q0YN82_HOLLE|nr:hypothetical protein HOLleu_34306 [Holothuria leucospilota]
MIARKVRCDAGQRSCSISYLRNNSVDERPRLPSPSIQRHSVIVRGRVEAEDDKNYEYVQHMVQIPQSIQQTDSYLIPDVQPPYSALINLEIKQLGSDSHRYDLMNPGTASDFGSLPDVTLQNDYGSSHDVTIPTMDMIYEVNPAEFLHSERERSLQEDVAKKLSKLQLVTSDKRTPRFSNTTIRSSVLNNDVQSVSSCVSSFSDLSYFALDENSIPCEVYERYSMAKYSKKKKNTMLGELNESPKLTF